MPPLPTDLEILDAIYDRYYATFAEYSDSTPSRSTKLYVPIDIKSIADGFGVDLDLVFGRLYYHLEKKHGYVDSDGAHVSFFAMRVAGDRHCINFPLMASVLADLRREDRKYRIATGMAAVSLLISVTTFVLSRLR